MRSYGALRLRCARGMPRYRRRPERRRPRRIRRSRWHPIGFVWRQIVGRPAVMGRTRRSERGESLTKGLTARRGAVSVSGASSELWVGVVFITPERSQKSAGLITDRPPPRTGGVQGCPGIPVRASRLPPGRKFPTRRSRNQELRREIRISKLVPRPQADIRQSETTKTESAKRNNSDAGGLVVSAFGF